MMGPFLEIELGPKGRWVLTCAAMALLAVASLAMWHGRGVGADAQAMITSAKALGYPTTPAELDAWYESVPAGHNAAIGYVYAGDLLRDSEPFYEPWPPAGEPVSAQQLHRAGAYLAQHADALELLHRAATLPQCRHLIDLSRPENFSPNHFQQMVSAVLLLKAQAAIAAEENRGDDAADALLAIMAMVRSLESEPTLEACSQARVFAAQMFDIFGRVLSHSEPSDEKLEQLVDAVRRSCNSRSVERAVAGNRVIEYYLVREYASRGGADSFESLIVAAAGPANVRRKIEKMLTAHAACLEMIREHPVDRWIEQSAQSDYRQLTLFGMIIAHVKHVARMRMVETAVAIERYRRLHGLPASLADLAVDNDPARTSMLVSPIDNEPLVYERSGNEYRLGCAPFDWRGEPKDPLLLVVAPQSHDADIAHDPAQATRHFSQSARTDDLPGS